MLRALIMLTSKGIHQVLLLTVSLLAIPAWALPTDKSQPIHISANNATIDDNTGITTYIGQVTMKQGSMEIHADKVELYRKNEEVTRIKATGQQANFRQQPQDNQPMTDAFGDTMDYQVQKQTLTITGNATVQQNADSFSGEKIVYQMDKAIVNAYGGASTQGRVQMVIQPKAK